MQGATGREGGKVARIPGEREPYGAAGRLLTHLICDMTLRLSMAVLVGPPGLLLAAAERLEAHALFGEATRCSRGRLRSSLFSVSSVCMWLLIVTASTPSRSPRSFEFSTCSKCTLLRSEITSSLPTGPSSPPPPSAPLLPPPLPPSVPPPPPPPVSVAAAAAVVVSAVAFSTDALSRGASSSAAGRGLPCLAPAPGSTGSLRVRPWV